MHVCTLILATGDRTIEMRVLEGRDGHAHDRRSDVRRAGIGVAQRHAVDEAVRLAVL